MGATVSKYFGGDVDIRFEDPRWLDFLRDHIDHHLLVRKATVLEVKPADAMRWRGDFFAFLRANGYGSGMDQVHMLINHFEHPTDFNENVKAVLVINDGAMGDLWTRFQEATNKHRDLETKKEGA